MTVIRRLARTHALPVALMLLVALATRLLVPTGYMIGQHNGHAAIILCPGTNPAAAAPAPVMAGMDGIHHAMAGHDQPLPEHDRPPMPCAFAGLSAQALAAVDPVLLVELLAFVTAMDVRPALPAMSPLRVYWRPLTRAPPATS